MATRGHMTKMKMSDGAEIGIYRVKPDGARRGGLVLIQENLRRHRAHQGMLRPLRR